MPPRSNKFKGLRVLRAGQAHTRQQSPGELRAGSYGLARWQRGEAHQCSGALPAETLGVDAPEKQRRTIRRPAIFRARLGSPLVLQWRAYPAVADGYRSRSRGAGPPAFLLTGVRGG